MLRRIKRSCRGGVLAAAKAGGTGEGEVVGAAAARVGGGVVESEPVKVKMLSRNNDRRD